MRVLKAACTSAALEAKGPSPRISGTRYQCRKKLTTGLRTARPTKNSASRLQENKATSQHVLAFKGERGRTAGWCWYGHNGNGWGREEVFRDSPICTARSLHCTVSKSEHEVVFGAGTFYNTKRLYIAVNDYPDD